MTVKDLPLRDLDLPTQWWGEVPLFNLQDALRLVNYCAEQGIAILGVDDFRIEDRCRIPSLSDTADFSTMIGRPGPSFSEVSVAAMRKFLTTMQPEGVLLEFVLVEPSN